MFFNSQVEKNSSNEFFNPNSEDTRNFEIFQGRSKFSATSFKKGKLFQANETSEDGINNVLTCKKMPPTIIFPSYPNSDSPTTPSSSNSRRKLFSKFENSEKDVSTPKTPPKTHRTNSRFTSTSIKKERKCSDRDFSEIESETTEKKKPKLRSYDDEYDQSRIIPETKPNLSNRLSNDYEVKEVIGKGSFGKVYRCIQKLDKLEYAVKETFRKFIGNHKSHALNETQALASLTAIDNNPNIVRYYSSWVEDEKLFLVMEYCPGSLKQEKKTKGTYSEEELKKILRDLCIGLKYIHSENMVHLDIKPENILISKTKKYKLGDLGQSRLAVNGSEDIEEGDARYLAHELLNFDFTEEDGSSLVKADIFSLGMTIFEMATDYEIPANGQEWHDLRNGKLDPLMSLPNLSDSFKKLIQKMLDKNPDSRPTAQEILTHYVPEEKEVEAKWVKIEYKMLKEQKAFLESMLSLQSSRRKSL